jgi:hypothetical protein
MNLRFAFLFAVALLAVGSPVRADVVEDMIAKARARLGSESALNAVTTIHFIGTLEMADPRVAADGKAQPSDHLEKMPAEIVFQKPYQHKMTVTRPKLIDVTTLDDYDGWARVTERENAKRWKISLLNAEQIKQLRANTWENLNFFGGLAKRGGMIKLEEDVAVDGTDCVKLSFYHSDRIVFHRYFEKSTGRLVKTETSSGGEIREEGEIVVDGIRFPKVIINKSASGQSSRMTIEKIIVNEKIPTAEFAVPSLASD